MKSTSRSFLALAGSTVLTISWTQAQNFTWDGGSGGNDNFGTAANWVGDSLPSTGSGVNLFFTGSTRTAPVNNYTSGDNFGEWRLTGAPSAFTITGNGFGLFGKIENSSTNSQLFTINTAGIYARDSSIEINPVGGGITIGSSTSITLDNNATLNVYNGGSGNTLTINGTLSKGNNTGGAGQIILWQTSNVILTGTNDYGGTTLNTGTTLRIGDGGITGTLGIGNVASSGSLFFNRSNDLSVSNLISGTGSVTKQGAGVLTLSNTNTYTGVTTLSAGTLSVGSIGNGGVAGNLGQASNAAGNLVFDGGTLRYTGSTATSDRAFTINAGKTATIDVTNGLSLAGATGAATTGALTKTGNGTLTLTGASTYTGATTVNLGRLALGNGGNLGATAVAINSRGTFAVTQSASSTANAITGSISLNSGATFTMADTFTSTLNVTGASALAPASGTGVISPLLVFDIIGAARDTLAIAGIATVGTAGAKISIAPSTTNVTPGNYTVISGAASSNLNANLSLVSGFLPNSGGLYTLSLASSTTTAAIVTVAADANARYWKGASSTAWNTAGNWTTDQAGTLVSGSAPGSTTNVAFSASTPANLTTNTLTAPLTVNSVNFLAGAATVTAGTTGNTANPLTINGGGITNGSANAMNINNPVTLGAAQTWTNTGAGLLTIGGAITNGANLLTVAGTGNTTISGVLGSGATPTGGLTMSGTGTLTLSNSNSYSGGTTISSGTIDVRNSSALGSGSVSVAAGGVLFVGFNGYTIANDIALNGMSAEGAINNNAPSAGNVTNLTGKITLNTTSNITTHWKDKTLQLSGKITGAGGLNFDLNLRSGAIGGRYYITGATNDYVGATAITGTASPSFGWTGQAMLYLGATNALPTTTALTLNYADLYLNGQSQTLPSISGSGSFSVQNGSTTAATLALGSGDTTSTFSGTIQDNGISVTNTSATPATVTGTVALTKIGNGTLTLTNTNAYTGATNVNGGKLLINGNQTAATGAVTVASTATLGGSGTIGGAVTVNPGGFHAAGNSIGTQTMLAGYTQNGTEQVELGTPGGTPAAGVSDRTVVTGALNLGGASTLQLIDNAGANAQGSMGAGAYRLITFSGTRTGTFNTITNPLNATLHEKVVYNGTSNGSVDLEVYRLATANAISTPVSLGNTRVGGTLSQNLSIQNTAASDGFSEGLNASGGSLTGNATTSGSITNLAGGSTSTAVSVGLNTSTAGAKTGTVAIGLASNGTNSGYANTALTGQTVTVNGAVYNAAVANTITSPVTLTKIRVGDSFGTSTLSISNTAPSGAFTEGLNATVGSTTGDASGSGSVSNLAGDSSSTSITVGLAGANTSTSGIKTGSVNINLASSGTNSGLADLGLGSQTVGVSGTVYEYADAVFSKTGGDGNLSGSGNSYTLDFGTGLALNTTYTATIQLANTLLSSFQDDLGGSYGSIVSSEFNSGFEGTTIASLVAGSGNTFTVTFFTGSTGSFSDTLTFSGLSKQSGLSDASLGNFTIALTATAVPEPRAALLGGLGLLVLLRRRR